MKKAVSYIGVAGLAFVGGWLLAPVVLVPYPLEVQRWVIVERDMIVEVPRVLEAETEPTPRPTDCVAMRWVP